MTTPLERKPSCSSGLKKYRIRAIRNNVPNRSSFLKGLILIGIIPLIASFSACSVGDDLPTGKAGSYQEQISDQQPEQQTETKLKVLTTIAPLYCFTKNIAGDFADVENLLSSGAGPHEYSFSPADIKKITEAQVIMKNGVNLDVWLDKLTAVAGKEKLTVVDTSSGVKIINKNPHIWLSPGNAIIQVKNIRDALIKADPENSERYMENTEKYIKRLDILDREIRDEVKTWRRKEFVAFHSAFLYFERDYGLRQVAVIQESPEEQPTPRHIANVINTIKTRDIRAIFTEPQASHKIIESISQDLNLQVYSLDTLEIVALYPEGKKAPGRLASPPGFSNGVYHEWYEDRMRANLEILKKALN